MVNRRNVEDIADVPRQYGVDDRLHRIVRARDVHGEQRRWHLLDNAPLLAERGVSEPKGTLLCVHGNPTYSYLFRSLLQADIPWRVIAVDQLEMGYSERTGTVRRLQDRITDLSLLTDSLDLRGKVITVGHDWGGIVSLGWALDNRDQLAGVILTNTAIYQGLDEKLPASLQLATAPGMLAAATSRTNAFLRTTLSLSDPPLPQQVREEYLAPYKGRPRRWGIEDFVADIPATYDHPSRPTLERLAEGVKELDVPTLMVWGPRDVVFSDRYLKDLLQRIPHADVHRYENASHLVWDDADVAGTVAKWLADNYGEQPREERSVSSYATQREPIRLGERISELAADPQHAEDAAVVEMHTGRTISWRLLDTRVKELAAGMLAHGVGPGDRVNVLVPPGADLTATIYACLRIGAVAVVADAGLGVKGLTRAVIGSHPDYIIGIEKALAAARSLNWPGQRISVRELPSLDRIALGVETSLAQLAVEGRNLLALDETVLGPWPEQDDDAAILFTSGSTGPAKGAVYTHRQLGAMFHAVGTVLGMRPERGLVAGFAPFALLGPAIGAPCVVPDMDVTAPATLTASALADAVASLGEPAIFTAPAALINILATAGELSETQRAALAKVPSFFSAGAPIPANRLRELKNVLPNATALTPYGMTECLAVTAIDLDGIITAGEGNGVCVGTPLDGVEVAIAPLTEDASTGDEPTTEPEVSGEVLVRAPHVRDRYLMLWDTTRHASRYEGWHATGDVGHLDAEGRLWIEGRMAHVMTTPEGVSTPVVIEKAVEQTRGVKRAGVCAVGPLGTQQLVVFVEPDGTMHRRRSDIPRPAPSDLAIAVRRSVFSATGHPVAAVYTTRQLPTDIRHNSKIDRAALARWAESTLRGRKAGRP
ncbi:alpha/beta fold hydrolase [Dermabacteraceae bacterium P13095]